MRRFKRWWWRAVFFLLLIVPGVVRVALDAHWWFLAPSIVGAGGLVWLMWDDHRQRRADSETWQAERREGKRQRRADRETWQAERRERERQYRHLLRILRRDLEERFCGDPEAEQKISRMMAEYEAHLAMSVDLGGPTAKVRLSGTRPERTPDA